MRKKEFMIEFLWFFGGSNLQMSCTFESDFSNDPLSIRKVFENMMNLLKSVSGIYDKLLKSIEIDLNRYTL